MPPVVFITGPAGSGKTTRLLQQTAASAQSTALQGEQKILAMAFMHGARKRMEISFAETAICARLPRKVTTIDGFSLDLLNRWRTALGFAWPFVPRQDEEGHPPFERDFRTHATFHQINQHAVDLLNRETVAKLIATSYPVVVIDEFQDCTDARLDVVRALSKVTRVILAADSFQVLDDTNACPAIDWVDSLDGSQCERHSLSGSHRTTKKPILDAARALRDNCRVADQTVPVYYGRPALLVYKIIERLSPGWGRAGSKWTGQTALVAPTHKALAEVITALEIQSQKKNLPRLRWTRPAGSEQERDELFSALGIENDFEGDYETAPVLSDPQSRAADVVDRAHRFARLRGLQGIPTRLVAHFAESDLHASRAYGHQTSLRTATTVHGAKNREFENVFVVWPYGVTGSDDKRRRFLYNAITRAKNNCVVLDLRRESEVTGDAVIALLGKAQPPFPPKPKKQPK